MEGLRAHGRGSRREARDRAVAMLEAVAVPDAARRLRSYPHELSGGLRQRAMMAMALVCGPRLLIADEPTTAVDVTVQAQILELLKDLQRRFGLSLLLISHDLGVVASLAERVAVMYAGQIIELGPTQEVLSRPQHPYTAGLLRSLPGLEGPRRNRLATLPGTVPDLTQLPPGCRFEPRLFPSNPGLLRSGAFPAGNLAAARSALHPVPPDGGTAAGGCDIPPGGLKGRIGLGPVRPERAPDLLIAGEKGKQYADLLCVEIERSQESRNNLTSGADFVIEREAFYFSLPIRYTSLSARQLTVWIR